MRKRLILLGIFVVVCAGAGVCFGATITVNWDGSGDYTTIQVGIDAAVYGDEVHVAAGTYVEAITLQNGVAVIGADPNATIINGGFDVTIVRSDNCDPNTVLEGFTITDGFGTFIDDVPVGGGMLNISSHPTVSNCIFNDNFASQGGGIYNKQSNPTVTDCTFFGNYGGGGMYNEQSNPVIRRCLFEQNSGRYGGGIRNINSSPVIEDCVFGGNISPFRGGGIYNQGSSGSITNCIFGENESDGSDEFGGGGGIYNEQSNMIITGCNFTSNSAPEGGGMYNNDSSPAVSYCTFSGNRAELCGSGMYNWDSSPNVSNCSFLENKALDYPPCDGAGMYSGRYSQPIVTDCTFRANKARYGGGMYNDFWSTSSGYGCAIVNGCTFENNTARIDGGGMYNDGYAIDVSPTVNVSNSIFRGNQANPDEPMLQRGQGGGIYNALPLTLTNCIFEENTAYMAGGGIRTGSLSMSGCVFKENSTFVEGGGIYNTGGITADNSSFLYNYSGSKGGGIYNADTGSLTATNCSFVGNSSDYGGGMYNHLSQEVNCINCTICYNTAEDDASAIYNYYSDTTVTNSVIWGNTIWDIHEWYYPPNILIQYSDVEGCGGSGAGWNYIGSDGGGNIDIDPLFVDPNNGDYHLQWDSPCVDAGDPAFVPEEGEVDIDGEPRLMGDRVDMGADEVGPKQADFTRDGRIDIEDFAVFSRSWDTQPTSENWYVLCDLIEDDIIDINDLAALAADWIWVSEWH